MHSSRPALARVVVALQDPNPLVAGAGIERLRAAGITVEVGLLADVARELNIGFVSRMLRGRPWVRAKAAISLDGRTALANGVSQWITGEAARDDGHAWRKRASALLTGVGTVLEDNPRLDVRRVETARQPLRVVVDSRLDMPLASRILDAPGRGARVRRGAGARAHRRAAGARRRDRPAARRRGKVDLRAMLRRPREARHQRTARRGRRASSMARSCAKAWSTSGSSTWRRSCLAPVASLPPSGRCRSWTVRSRCASTPSIASATICAFCCAARAPSRSAT